jgi:hypothetical protein
VARARGAPASFRDLPPALDVVQSKVPCKPALRATNTMAVAIQTMPVMNGHNGDVEMSGLVDTGPRFATGLILPPPEIKCA